MPACADTTQVADECVTETREEHACCLKMNISQSTHYIIIGLWLCLINFFISTDEEI